jgi:hypothetical protein
LFIRGPKAIPTEALWPYSPYPFASPGHSTTPPRFLSPPSSPSSRPHPRAARRTSDGRSEGARPAARIAPDEHAALMQPPPPRHPSAEPPVSPSTEWAIHTGWAFSAPTPDLDGREISLRAGMTAQSRHVDSPVRRVQSPSPDHAHARPLPVPATPRTLKRKADASVSPASIRVTRSASGQTSEHRPSTTRADSSPGPTLRKRPRIERLAASAPDPESIPRTYPQPRLPPRLPDPRRGRSGANASELASALASPSAEAYSTSSPTPPPLRRHRSRLVVSRPAERSVTRLPSPAPDVTPSPRVYRMNTRSRHREGRPGSTMPSSEHEGVKF